MRGTIAASIATFMALAGISLAPTIAEAHVGVTSGPAYANTTQEILFGVGHGCAGSDTLSIRIEIPVGVTSVRAGAGDLGKPTIERDDAQSVVAVTWEKPEEDLIPGDDNYYKLMLRLKVPNQPFTTLYFPTRQTCQSADGTITVVDWVGKVQNEAEGMGVEPAPAVVILPAKRSGWNKWKVPQAVPDLAAFFGDAQIVWKGTAAYSANPATVDQLKATAGVTSLTALAAGDEIWVKY